MKYRGVALCLYQWVSDVGVWVYVYVCEKGRTKKGPGEVLRVTEALGHARRTPLLTSELVTKIEVEFRQGHVLQGNDVACSERYSEG